MNMFAILIGVIAVVAVYSVMTANRTKPNSLAFKGGIAVSLAIASLALIASSCIPQSNPNSGFWILNAHVSTKEGDHGKTQL